MNPDLKYFLKKNYYIYLMISKFRYFLTCFGRVKYENHACARIKKSIIGRNNSISIYSKAIVKDTEVYIRGDRNVIEIGEGCIIGKKCSIRIEGNDCCVLIGKNTTMTRDIHLCVQEHNMKIEIGEDCMFSNNIIVRTSDSHPIYDINGVRINLPQNVQIGNHVWIAPESTILKGVHIGNNAIIGSKSLVTKDVEANCLYAGIPAKVIKRNVKWTRENLF